MIVTVLDDTAVFMAMKRKDPDLYATFKAHWTASDAMYAWVEKYPEDFPQRGLTAVNDASAIRTNEAMQQLADQAQELDMGYGSDSGNTKPAP